MRWHDINDSAGQAPWQGLALTLERAARPAKPPGLCVRARAGRLRIDAGLAPRVWARVHRWHHGVWTLVTDQTSSLDIVPPIRNREIRAIKAEPGSAAWWRLWARHFAGQLSSSPRSPLHDGRWILSPARATDSPSLPIPGASALYSPYLSQVERLATCLDDPSVQWESWWTSGSGAALRMRSPSDPGSARVKALRKLAREGVMPPLLFLFVSGLDMFVLVDGHDRLRALLLEKAPIPLFVLMPVRASAREPDRARQAAIEREIERRNIPGASRKGPLPVRVMNELLLEAFDNRPWLFPKSRAFDLPGGVAGWAAEVADTFGLPPEHPAFSGEPPARD